MVFKLALNRCCCEEEECDILSDVCRVTISFSGVEQPISGADFPFISPAGNPLSNAGECVADAERGNCLNWNRQWELFPVESVGCLPADPSLRLLCTLALGQAGGGHDVDFLGSRTGGFSIQPGVYSLPPLESGGGVLAQAGSACFPCADFLWNMGLELILTCIGNELTDVELVLYTADGTNPNEVCQIINWSWEPFVPDKINEDGSEGTGRQADAIREHPSLSLPEVPQTECYRPRGVCADPLDVFPFCKNEIGEADQDFIVKFYDTLNCYWDALPTNYPVVRFYKCIANPPPLNPAGCDDCITQVTHVMHFDFSPVGGGGQETSVQGAGATYVEGNYWTLTENNGRPGELNTLASGDVQLAFPCWYEVFIRYSYPDFDPLVDNAGEIRIFNVQGSGGLALHDVDVDFPIEGATADIDGDHNTDMIDGFQYQRLGVFQMHDPDAAQNWVRIEVEGPPRDSMIFDDLVLRRL